MDQPETAVREVTLSEAMAIGVNLQKHGKLAEAAQVYRQVLEAAPGHPDALHFSGVLAHQEGRSDEAVTLIEQSLAADPEQADCHSNLGIVHRDCGRLDRAVESYRRAIAINPRHANAYNDLGIVLRAQGRVEEAEQAYRTAIEIVPEHIGAYHNLGTLLAGIGRTKEAVVCYCKVTTLSANQPETRRLLAMAHCTLGETEKAVEIFRQWVAEEPNHPIARHMLAACSGEAVPGRASDAFVETLFDAFASSFDSKLAALSYRAPSIVGAMVTDSGFEPAKTLAVLDAGCGTGLCGPLVAPYARTLTGVDLSARMLAQAKEKGVYDDLVKAELSAFLAAHPAEYDLIVSADTLVYFGDLSGVFHAAEAALLPGGLFIFTVEAQDDAEAEPGYVLHNHGRYGHARGYVERELAAAGFSFEIVNAELRMEAGEPVAGLAVRARVRD
jgi:predicted TPR repeat methyltransferase